MSQNVAQLGRLDFTGSFEGFLNDFVANLSAYTKRFTRRFSCDVLRKFLECSGRKMEVLHVFCCV